MFKKLVFPVSFTLIGLAMVIVGMSTGQNGAFMFGAFAALLAGALSVVSAAVPLNKVLRMSLSVGLLLLIGGLSLANYMSIKVPIDFQAEKEKRYEHVIQRLKDIRTAELAYRTKYQKYTGNVDSLVSFVENDSLPVIKAMGEVPDTMTLENAIKAGIATRDTFYVSVKDTLFKLRPSDNRAHPFVLDSMVVVPFTGGKKFKLEAGFVERSGVKVPVFQATDSHPFDKRDVLQVGSMSDPKTNGNWE